MQVDQNRFMLASSLGGQTTLQVDAGASLTASGSQLLSNQLNNWISQANLLPVTLGLNYRARDAYSKEEMEVMFSKSVFNDRITIDGNVGVATGASATSTTNANSLVGDFSAEYKYSNLVRFRAFNKTNTNTIIFNNSPYTQGIGIFFRKEFDTPGSKKKRLPSKVNKPD